MGKQEQAVDPFHKMKLQNQPGPLSLNQLYIIQDQRNDIK